MGEAGSVRKNTSYLQCCRSTTHGRGGFEEQSSERGVSLSADSQVPLQSGLCLSLLYVYVVLCDPYHV